MKQKNLLFKLFMVMVLMGFMGSSVTIAQTLKHSYTFEDGTPADVVGGIDGILHGDAVIEDGALIVSGDGFMALSGKQINIPSYGSVTIEALYSQAPGLTGFTSLFAFGMTNPEVAWMGVDYLIYQPTRNDDIARTAVSTGNYDNPWATETAVNHDMVTDTNTHFVVVVLTATDLTLYFDGQLIGTEPFAGNNSLATISNDTIYIANGVYPNDPHWQGSVYEMNIYEGTMSETDVEQRFRDIMGDSYFEPRLKELSFSRGVLEPEFDPDNQDFDLYVPFGTTSVSLTAVPIVNGATVEVYDGFGNPAIDENGNITFTEDGIDLEVLVTALDGIVTATYYIYVFHDPGEISSALTDITLSTGRFVSEFDMDVFEYDVIVPNGTTSVEVTAVPAWEGASVSGDGNIAISDGTAIATIEVTSEDGSSSSTFTVNLYESVITTGQNFYIQHEPSGWVVGDSGEDINLIRLAYPLINQPDQLFQLEDSGVEGQYFLKNQNDLYLTLTVDPVWNMIMVPELTQNLDSCRFEFDEFEPGRFRIITVARAELETKYMGPNNNNVGGGVYSDKPINNALITWNVGLPEDVVGPYDLNLIELSLGEDINLNPEFSMARGEYYVTLPIGTTSVTIEATPRDATSTVNGTGTIEVESEGVLTVTVVGENPEYTKDYVINYAVDTPHTLRHSYTFADGTARDVVGEADGLVMGGTITEGVFTSHQNGDFIELPADVIAINKFPSITLEAYVLTDGENPGFSMLSYFGDLNGVNSYWMQLTRNDDQSRVEINTGGVANVQGTEPGIDEYHHYVSVLTNDTLYWYIDGMLAARIETPHNAYIGGISTANAWLCQGGYPDPTWLGSILEFNIYSGQMDEQTVALRSTEFPQEDASTDATLIDLMVDGVTIDGFHPANLNYSFEATSTEIPEVTVETKNPAATYKVNAATELPGETTIVVTAADGVTEITYTINITSTGVGFEEPVKTSQIKVYPTVSSGVYYVEAPGSSSIVTIYDLAGRVYKQIQTYGTPASFTIENNGMYLVKVESEDTIEWFKVIKRN